MDPHVSKFMNHGKTRIKIDDEFTIMVDERTDEKASVIIENNRFYEIFVEIREDIDII